MVFMKTGRCNYRTKVIIKLKNNKLGRNSNVEVIIIQGP